MGANAPADFVAGGGRRGAEMNQLLCCIDPTDDRRPRAHRAELRSRVLVASYLRLVLQKTRSSELNGR